MSDLSIDSVSVEIKANADKATGSIDGLISSIEKLQSTLGNVGKGVSEFTSGLKGVSSSESGMKNVSKDLDDMGKSSSKNPLNRTSKELKRIIDYSGSVSELKSRINSLYDANKKGSIVSPELEKAVGEYRRLQQSGKASAAELQEAMDKIKQASDNIGIEKFSDRLKLAFEGAKKSTSNLSNNINKIKDAFSKIISPVKKVASAISSIKGKVKDAFNNKHLDLGLKKLSKYVLALFSVRGAYALVSSMSNHWLSSSNEAAKQLNANIDYLKYAMGSAVSGVMTTLVNMVYSLLKGIQQLIYSFTGVNIFAKAFAKNMSSASGSASSIKNSIAGFDELNVIGQSSGSGSGSDTTSPTFDLTEVDLQYYEWVEKLKNFFEPLVESWKTYGGQLLTQAKETFEQVAGLMKSVWKSLEEIIVNGTVYKSLELMLAIIGDIAEAFQHAWDYEGNGTKIIQNLADTFNNLLEAIDNFVSSEGFQKWLNNAIQKIEKMSEKLSTINWQPLIDTLGKIAGTIGNAALWIMERFVDGLKWIAEHPDVVTTIINIYVAFKLFSGLINLIDTVAKIETTFNYLKKIKDIFSKIITVGKNLINSTFGGIVLVISGIIIAVKNFIDMWKNGFSWIKETLMVVGIAIAAIGAIILGVPALIAGVIAGIVALIATAVVVIKEHWEEIKTFFIELWDKIKEIWEGIKTTISDKFEQAKEKVVEKITNIKDKFGEILDKAKEIWEGIKTTISDKFEQTKEKIAEKITNIKDKFGEIWDKVKEVFENVKNTISEKIDSIKNKFGEILDKVKEVWEGIKTTITDKFEQAKLKVTEKITNIKDKFGEIWSKVKEVWEKIKTEISNKISDIKTNITDKINNIKTTFGEIWDKAKEVWDKIKSKFSETFSIKLPHLSWNSNGTQTTGLIKKALEALSLPTTLPKLSVSWYAEGGLPDVGELFVANEAGPEMVGKIGNQTAVANNDQITAAISQATYQAVSQALKENQSNNKTEVYIGNDKVYSGYGRYQNRQANKYGVSTVTV